MVKYEEIAHPDTLRVAWRQLQAKGAASPPVIDVVEDLDYASDLKANLKSLAHRLDNRTYRPGVAFDLPTTKPESTEGH